MPPGVHYQRQQVGLGEVAIVVRVLLAAHAVGLALGGVVEARLLHDLAAGFEHANLPLDLVFERLPDEAERIDVLDLGLGAEFLLPARTYADVGIAAQRAFLHVAVAHAGEQDDFLQPRQVLVGFVGEAISGSLTISASGTPQRFRSRYVLSVESA